MAVEVTIQWCPSCKAWGKSTRGATELLNGVSSAKRLGLFAFEYRRVLHQCYGCGSDFVTTNVTKCDADYRWHANAEIGRFGRQSGGVLATVLTGPDTVCWDLHPELADFSASVMTG